ncbi:MAG: lysophospholipid acyltransferase family protein [Thioalkalispiraceae bacterium]
MKSIYHLLWRIPLLVLHILSGLLQELVYLALLGKSWHRRPFGQHAIKYWMHLTTAILGLKITVNGTPAANQQTMIVANHISWLDIIALLSIQNSVFLAKDEVKHWPVIGYLVRSCGTLFIKRGNKTMLKHAISELVAALRRGQSVTLFPEGTTTEGSEVRNFYSGLFSAAIKTESLIQPVAIAYIRGGQPDLVAPYTEEASFIRHLLRLLRQDNTQIVIEFLPELCTHTLSRSELARITRQKIQQAIHEIKLDHGIVMDRLPLVESA